LYKTSLKNKADLKRWALGCNLLIHVLEKKHCILAYSNISPRPRVY